MTGNISIQTQPRDVYFPSFGRCEQSECRKPLTEQNLADSTKLGKRLGCEIDLCSDCLDDQALIARLERGDDGEK